MNTCDYVIEYFVRIGSAHVFDLVKTLLFLTVKYTYNLDTNV